MKEYKYIFLVIYSENNSVYNEMYKHILKYSKLFSDSILTMFLVGDHNINGSYEYNNETQIFRHKVFENTKNIFYKTISAMEYCLANFNFKYIIRTNISSFWNYNKIHLLDNLVTNEKAIYGYKAKIKEFEFIVGYCIIMSKLACEILCNNKNSRKYNNSDDINISEICKNNGIELVHLGIVHPFTRECGYNYAKKVVIRQNNSNIMLYRVRSSNREYFDLNIFKLLSETIYKIVS